MKVFFLLVLGLAAASWAAENAAKAVSPDQSEATEDLKTSESIGFGFYAGGYPFYRGYGGYYGYPYGFGYPYRKYWGYPYYGIRAYPALPFWG